jgi:hypothetical protein
MFGTTIGGIPAVFCVEPNNWSGEMNHRLEDRLQSLAGGTTKNDADYVILPP